MKEISLKYAKFTFRVFAQPFIASLDGHHEGVSTLTKHPLRYFWSYFLPYFILFIYLFYLLPM